MFLKEFMQSQAEMRWSTILLRPHLFHGPSAGEVRYNVIFHSFKIWNTVDLSVKEIWAGNMNDNHTSPYHDVWCMVFHTSRVMRIPFGQKIISHDGELRLIKHSSEKRNHPRGKSVGNGSIRKAAVSLRHLTSPPLSLFKILGRDVLISKPFSMWRNMEFR